MVDDGHTTFTPCFQNVKAAYFIDLQNVLLPVLHIKLGRIISYLKPLDNDGSIFNFCRRNVLMSPK